jgi:hypothetical protein
MSERIDQQVYYIAFPTFGDVAPGADCKVRRSKITAIEFSLRLSAARNTDKQLKGPAFIQRLDKEPRANILRCSHQQVPTNCPRLLMQL